MKHFYKLMSGPSNAPLMTEVMRKRAELFDDKGDGKTLPLDAKRMALGIMQVVNATGLDKAELAWLNHDGKSLYPANGSGAHYIAVLSGQVMCLADDECPALNAGEVWWVDAKDDAIILNKSGDDAVVLRVSLKVDD